MHHTIQTIWNDHDSQSERDMNNHLLITEEGFSVQQGGAHSWKFDVITFTNCGGIHYFGIADVRFCPITQRGIVIEPIPGFWGCYTDLSHSDSNPMFMSRSVKVTGMAKSYGKKHTEDNTTIEMTADLNDISNLKLLVKFNGELLLVVEHLDVKLPTSPNEDVFLYPVLYLGACQTNKFEAHFIEDDL